jgi:hypothetical protein
MDYVFYLLSTPASLASPQQLAISKHTSQCELVILNGLPDFLDDPFFFACGAMKLSSVLVSC